MARVEQEPNRAGIGKCWAYLPSNLFVGSRLHLARLTHLSHLMFVQLLYSSYAIRMYVKINSEILTMRVDASGPL